MSHNLEYVNLPGDSLNVRLILDLVFLQNFDSNFFSSKHMRAKPHLAKCALAEGPTFKKIIYLQDNPYPRYSDRFGDC